MSIPSANAKKTRSTASAGTAKPERFTDFFTYRLSFLTKRIDMKTARMYQELTGLNLAEARAVSIIAALEPLTVQQLAGYGSLDKSQASRVAVSLLDKGLVTKSGSSDDARAVSISLTARGRKVCAVIMEIARTRNQEALQPLNTQEQRLLLALLDRVMTPLQGKEADAES